MAAASTNEYRVPQNARSLDGSSCFAKQRRLYVLAGLGFKTLLLILHAAEHKGLNVVMI